jgi:hypothetical protein
MGTTLNSMEKHTHTLSQTQTLTVRVEHGHNFKHKLLAQHAGFSGVSCEVLDQASHHPAGVGLARMHSRCRHGNGEHTLLIVKFFDLSDIIRLELDSPGCTRAAGMETANTSF